MTVFALNEHSSSLSRPEPDWEITRYTIPNNRAALGKRGIVAGVVESAGSGLSQLAIRVSETEFVFIPGDWRSVGAIGQLIGREVEVVEGLGSAYGVHSIEWLDESPNEAEENGGNC